MEASGYEETLPAEDYEYAKQFLGETAEQRNKMISEILQWLKENPQINAPRNAVAVLRFLRATRFRLDVCKKRIETFYKMRAERLEWFANRDPFDAKIAALFDLGLFLPLANKDVNNSQVFVIRTGVHNALKHKQNDVFKAMKMALDVAIHLDESISIYGAVAIFDMSGVSWHHAMQMKPTTVKRAVHCWENYSCHVKKMEFINAPTHINIVLDIFRQFMSEKLRDRLVVTRGPSAVNVVLPSDLGGHGKSYAELTDHWKRQIQAHAGWFSEQDQFKSIL